MSSSFFSFYKDNHWQELSDESKQAIFNLQTSITHTFIYLFIYSFIYLFINLFIYLYEHQAITFEPERLPNLYGKGGEMIKYIGTCCTYCTYCTYVHTITPSFLTFPYLLFIIYPLFYILHFLPFFYFFFFFDFFLLRGVVIFNCGTLFI